MDPAIAPNAPGAPHVVVVGGGLAGIAAGLECRDLGAAVTLLERRSHLGGLTWSFRHGGLWVDNGQHVFLRCCDQYLWFLNRIGADRDVVIQPRLDIPVVAAGSGGRPPRLARLRRSSLPAPLHTARSLMGFPFLPVADRLRLGRAAVALRSMDLDDPDLDRVTFRSWLLAHGQSEAAIASVWDLITVPTVNLPASEASLAMAAKVFQTGLLRGRAAADIGWSRVPLARLHGERAEAALLRSGSKVVTGIRVTGVDLLGSGGFRVWTDREPLDADAVVVALPHDEAAVTLPPDSVANQERLPELGSSAVVDVHFVFDRRVTEYAFMAALGSPVQWVFDRTAASGLAEADPSAQYLAVSLSAADTLLGRRPEDLISWIRKELERLLPEVAGARLVDSLVTKERKATFRARPGSASLRPPAATALPGLAVAGAWTATGWPATMEGAVRSGRAAARAVTAAAVPLPRRSFGANPAAGTTFDRSSSTPEEVA
jgi:squalene-associated FAD-dependent desaturase